MPLGYLSCMFKQINFNPLNFVLFLHHSQSSTIQDGNKTGGFKSSSLSMDQSGSSF